MAASTDRYEVLILGAGVAGLAAARILAEAGRRVAIIEARDRIGGRIFTDHVPAAAGSQRIAVELGAEFVHGFPPVTWNLIDEAKLETYELDGAQLCYSDGRLEACVDEPDGAFAVLQQMTQWLAAQPPGRDVSFAEYLRLAAVPAPAQQRAGAYVEGFNAADRNLIGVASLAQQQRAEDAIQGGRIFHIKNGYDGVTQFLAQRFRAAGGAIFLNRRVRDVHWRPGAVAMSGIAPDGCAFEFNAARAAITLPLGVLQAQAVRFAPPPEQAFSQIRRLVMGAALRMTLVFRSRFWVEEVARMRPDIGPELERMSFLFAYGQQLSTWWSPYPNSTPTITLWAGGPKAAEFDRAIHANGGRDALLQRALAELASVFALPASRLAELLLSSHFHDWQADEFALGSYSYAAAGARDAAEKLTEPVDSTLFFAGEHTDIGGHWGTVHGAIASGIRAAGQIAASRE